MPILGIIASSRLAAVPNSYESIATVTVGSGGAANVEFTSIPGTYTHLQIRTIQRGGGSSIQVNGDTGTNYKRHYVYGNGSSVSAGTGGATDAMSITTYTNTANTFAGNVIDILDYTNTNKYKTFRVLCGVDEDGSGEMFLFSGLWLSTSAITSLKFIPGTIAEYSQFALYGIKGA
jgi:hypothetical protein